MLLEEIRRDTVDSKGRKHNKIVCVALAEEDSIIISIKNRDFDEAVLVDLVSIIKPYVDEEMMDNLKTICNSIYTKLNYGNQIAS